MKIKCLIVFLCLVSGCATNTQKKEIQSISGYVGYYNCDSVGTVESYVIPYKKCDEISVVIPTDTIDLATGVAFGIEYIIPILRHKTCQHVTHQLIHPPMKTPNGKIVERYARTFKIGQCEGDSNEFSDVFSWRISKEWEAVKGKWNFQVFLDGEPVASATFNVQ